jgi:hypothetical protein
MKTGSPSRFTAQQTITHDTDSFPYSKHNNPAFFTRHRISPLTTNAKAALPGHSPTPSCFAYVHSPDHSSRS